MTLEPTNDDAAPAGEQAADARFAAALRDALTTAAAAGAIAPPPAADRLLDLLVRTAARAIPSPEGALFLVDTARRVLTFDVVIGATASTVKDLTVPLGHGVAGLVAVSGQPLAIANAQEDPRHARDIAARSGYLPTTILAVPVIAPSGAVLGVLELLDRRGQPTYDLNDMDLLGRFAQVAALLLDQRRADAARAMLLARALSALSGLPPEMERRLADNAAGVIGAVDADPATRRAVELAGLVATIAARGPAAQQACVGVLEAFAGYLRATPAPGGWDLPR